MEWRQPECSGPVYPSSLEEYYGVAGPPYQVQQHTNANLLSYNVLVEGLESRSESRRFPLPPFKLG